MKKQTDVFLLNTPSKKSWEKLGLGKRAGTIVPVSFLRSRASLGIGDFADLRLYIDFAYKRAETIVQILPLNDSGERNLWPYAAMSGFALNPVYIAIKDVLGKYKEDLLAAYRYKIGELLEKAYKWEKKEIVHYVEVRKNKLVILQMIYKCVQKKIAKDLEFFKKEHAWVLPYALFMVLKKENKDIAWQDWQDQELRDYSVERLKVFYKENKFEVDFFIFLQMEALEQLERVRVYAQTKKVFLEGDVPLLVSQDSADVWSQQDCFLLDFGAGAPPDMFAKAGQAWGMPPLNWEQPKAKDYFIAKFKFAEKYMDLVRIDHILGMFRLFIWSKKRGNIANQGFFYEQVKGKEYYYLTEKELKTCGITDPQRFCGKEGFVTDKHYLEELAARLVAKGWAIWVEKDRKIGWSQEQNLEENEDGFTEKLLEDGFSKDEVSCINLQRRRLQNMIVPYLDVAEAYAFTFYGKDTWQYLNLEAGVRQNLDNLLNKKKVESWEVWRNTGTDFLKELLTKTNLLLCGEDLGLVDDYVPEVLEELGIPGLSVLRWDASFKKEQQRKLAILTLGTHDTSTVQQWWTEESTSIEVKNRFFREYLGEVTYPEKLRKKDLQRIFADIYDVNSIFVLLPFWEMLAVWYGEPDKRMNMPGVEQESNWVARMQRNLDDYLQEEEMTKFISTKIKQARR
ncbi:hypothetical protein HN928_04695 [bacterium]|jgi:4-alpha-glucanotransferase|nr:hypothetical protein [bacterium]MBT3581351.1 hypothetical protein [bacterium]MBT7088242.1 hypothetical protein [bacterium]